MNATRCIGLGLFVTAVAFAASNSYAVRFYQDVRVAGTDIKAGDYKVEIRGDVAAFKSGNNMVEVPANLQSADRKFPYTAVHTSDKDVSEIDLAGTSSKLIFSPAEEQK